MPKYLFIGKYNTDGIRGVLAEGGSGRAGAARDLVTSLGGQVEAFYYAFGENDFYLLADLPGSTEAIALSFAVGASGAMTYRTVVLLTPEELDDARKLKPLFRTPYGPNTVR